MMAFILIRNIAAFFAILWGLCASAEAQVYRPYGAQTGEKLPPIYAMQRKEISALCGTFLPNQIGGITEIMTLCGGRLGIKTGERTFTEATVLSGAGHGQRYILGSLGFRTDVAFDDVIASFFLGGDVHYPTTPVIDPNTGLITGDQTLIYFGGHLGGSLWGEINDSLYARIDMKFNFNPGTSLFVGLALVLRFDQRSNDQVDESQYRR